MLKGHVFSKQIFGNPIFALFINTFLNGRNGVSNNFKNGMAVTYSGSNLNVNTGAVCIQGRFLEEDSGTQISAGTENMYCKLVIEVNLNLENTNSDFVQGAYKIVKSASGYPNLTQNNIVKNVSGIYQYELARFRTGVSGITEFKDMRTFLDFNSIYDALEKEYRAILQELENELANVKDGSAYLLKEGGTITGSLTVEDGIQSRILPEVLTNENLNDYMTTGFFYAPTQNTVKNKPSGVTWFGLICFRGSGTGAWIQLLVAEKTYIRKGEGDSWSNWSAFFTETGGELKGNLRLGGYSIFIDSGSIFVESGGISTDTGDIVSGGNLGCDGDFHCAGNMKSDYTYRETTTASANVYISDNCNFRRSASSSERYKTDITEEIEERLNPEVLYNLPVKQFK